MSTKTGQMRHGDFRKGVTAWVVTIEAQPNGTFLITPPYGIVIEAPPFVYESQMECDDCVVYQDAFAVEYKYLDPTQPEYNQGGVCSFSYAEFGIPGTGLEDWSDTKYRNRLFRKKKHAEKYVASFNELPTHREIVLARQVNDFMSAMDDLPQPVYDPLPKDAPMTFRNKKRFLRPPGQALRRIGWPHDRAPTAYLESGSEAYDNAVKAYMLTHPAGSLPYDDDDKAHELEVTLGEHIASLPGHPGRRSTYVRPTRKVRKEYKRWWRGVELASLAALDDPKIQGPELTREEAKTFATLLKGKAKAEVIHLTHQRVREGAGLVDMTPSRLTRAIAGSDPTGEIDPLSIQYTGQMNRHETYQEMREFTKPDHLVIYSGVNKTLPPPNPGDIVYWDPSKEATVVTPLFNKTAHADLTAACRAATGYGKPESIANMTTNPDTYKGLEDGGVVPHKPNEAS